MTAFTKLQTDKCNNFYTSSIHNVCTFTIEPKLEKTFNCFLLIKIKLPSISQLFLRRLRPTRECDLLAHLFWLLVLRTGPAPTKTGRVKEGLPRYYFLQKATLTILNFSLIKLLSHTPSRGCSVRYPRKKRKAATKSGKGRPASIMNKPSKRPTARQRGRRALSALSKDSIIV